MMRNNEKSRTVLLGLFAKTLRRELPRGWELTQSSAINRPASNIVTKDFHIFAPDGSRAKITAISRDKLTPASTATTIEWVNKTANSPGQTEDRRISYVVVAPFVSPRSQELLRNRGMGWFDSTRNMYITLDRPSLMYKEIGKNRDPESRPDDRRLKSLKGSKAARVIRTLLESNEKIGVRELATKSRVGYATSARVIEYLDREKLISRDTKGAVVDAQKEALLRAWTRDYQVTTSNRVVTGMSARGIDNVLKLLPGSELTYAITGSATTDAYLPADTLPAAPTSLLMVYVDDVPAAQEKLKVRPADRGINVFLLEPFDDVVYQGARTVNGLRYVAQSQAIADLLTGPGRSDEEAKQLLEEVPIT